MEMLSTNNGRPSLYNCTFAFTACAFQHFYFFAIARISESSSSLEFGSFLSFVIICLVFLGGSTLGATLDGPGISSKNKAKQKHVSFTLVAFLSWITAEISWCEDRYTMDGS